MKFRRNLFFPIRLILYPILLQIILVVNNTFTSEIFWALYSLCSLLLLIEAVWEFVVPYAIFDGTVFQINSYIFSKKEIDLSKFTADQIKIGRWDIEIGPHFINLRKVRTGYRERLEEAVRYYYEGPPDSEHHTELV